MPYPTYPSVNVPAVPTPRLEHYLDFWESERDAARSLQSPAWAQTPYHAEWDINVPVPRPWFFRPGGRDFLSFAGLEVQSRELREWSAGSGLRVVGQPIGQDPTAIVNRQSGVMYVTATWAQRAANAFLATVGAAPIQVDGVVGAQTLTALRFVMLRWYAALTGTAVVPDTGQAAVGGFVMPVRSGTGVALVLNFANYLAGLTQVADPAPIVHQTDPPPDTTPPPPVDIPVEAAGGGGLLLLVALGIGAYAYSRSR